MQGADDWVLCMLNCSPLLRSKLTWQTQVTNLRRRAG
jgi:hypothetical protein